MLIITIKKHLFCVTGAIFMVLIIRTILLYSLVIISLRVMGKRQLGEMQPSELVVAIMISDLAAVPMQAIDIPLVTGIIPVLTLIVAEVFMSYISLKSGKLRKILSGEPSIIIYDGHINEGELERLRFNMHDLLEQLRINNYPNISDIDCAVMETNGKLSVIPKSSSRPVTVADMNIKTEQEKLQHLIMSDGKINLKELEKTGKSREWLLKELKKLNLGEQEVFFAIYDFNHGLITQKKGEKDKGTWLPAFGD